MRFISRNVLTGLVTVLPVVLTLYLLYWFAVSMESVLGGVIKLALPESYYWPGMGLFAGLIVVFLVGLLMHAYLVQRLFAMAEQIVYRMPIVNTIYRSIRDFFKYFSPSDKKEFEQVVAVRLGETGLQLIGFVTQDDPRNMPRGLDTEDSVLVYLPMSYMVGGYAIYMSRSFVTPLDLSMEEAMRLTLTAGVAGVSNTQNQGKSKTRSREDT